MESESIRLLTEGTGRGVGVGVAEDLQGTQGFQEGGNEKIRILGELDWYILVRLEGT